LLNCIHPLKQIVRFKLCSYLIAFSYDNIVPVVHTGESTAEIETEAGSNDVTESAYPLHDNIITGMFGFCDDMCSTLICLCNVRRVEKLSADSALGFWQQSLYHAHSASMGGGAYGEFEQDAQLSQRDRAAGLRYIFRQKQNTRTGRQYFSNIIGLSLTTVI